MSVEPIDAAAVPPRVVDLARRVAARGGRALVVGGWVRDRLRGASPIDVDVEVHGLGGPALDGADLDEVLAEIGEVRRVGRAFAIRLVRGLGADVSWAGPESSATGAEALAASYAAAARRRDLTINSIGFDPLDGSVLDPLGGRDDLEARRLRACDPARFGEDPVRALRTAGLAARLEMTPDDELLRLCAAQPLDGAPGERLMLEWTRLLALAPRPGVALTWLGRMDQLRVFPEIDALRGVEQDPRWHPEGDVFVHTGLALDAAASLRTRSEDPVALAFGTLCHDFGKPGTTRRDGDRVRSIGHERAGLAPTRAFLRRLEASKRLMAQVEILVDRHLAPGQLVAQGAGDKAYRRLVRLLDQARVTPALLEAVARADHLGRTTEDARLGRFEGGDRFLERIEALGLMAGPDTPVVQGRHLVERGIQPGPEYGAVLDRCLALQDETGLRDPEALLERVLGS